MIELELQKKRKATQVQNAFVSVKKSRSLTLLIHIMEVSIVEVNVAGVGCTMNPVI